MMSSSGYRGYVFSRPIGEHRVPQHIQNLVIRDYAKQRNFVYLLSGVEYRMNNSYIMLNEILTELNSIEGIILYSMFMLPEDQEDRLKIFNKIIEKKTSLHAAVEGMSLVKDDDVIRWQNIFSVSKVIETQNFEKDILCQI
jgi:sporadic carbohydrate cluster protein (TIGR04323 family)